MSIVLAAIDDSAAAAPVALTATLMAQLLGAHAACVHVVEGDTTTVEAIAARAELPLELRVGEAISEIVSVAADPEIELVVIGSRCHPAGRRPCGHVARAVLEEVSKPVVVVPPDASITVAAATPLRILVPLEGTEGSTHAVEEILAELASAGAELTALHVFDAASQMPRFWDHAAHAEQSWASAFAARWCTESNVDIHLRTGVAATEVLKLIEQEEIDLVVAAWSQELREGRAEIVSRLLGSASVPTLLVPEDGGSDEGTTASPDSAGRGVAQL